jgi:hypothetical protein
MYFPPTDKGEYESADECKGFTSEACIVVAMAILF